MDLTDQRLLAQAAAGDADAFAVFFRRHERLVTRFAVARAGGADEVADVVSETFLAALRGAGRYEPEHPHAVPWLLGIAVNVVLRRERSARRRLRLGARVAGTTPRYAGAEADAVARAVDATRRGPALAAALATLPARERAVLELVAYADLSPGEAAVALGISSNAARLRLSRARTRMRAALGEREHPTDLEAADAR